MAGTKHPLVQTLATFDADLTCGGLSLDLDGNCYVSQNAHGVVAVFSGARGMQEVPIDFIEPEEFICAAFTPDAKLMFVRTEAGAIWRVPMVAPAKPGTAEQVVGPLTEQPQPHCTGLRLTDTHLWFWRTNTELMRMDVRASGPHAHAVLAATLQPPEGQKIPSWQLDPASWLVYYKAQISQPEIIVLNAHTGSQYTINVPGMQPAPDDSDEGLWMAGCTGDGQLLLIQEPSPLKVMLWDPHGGKDALPREMAEFDTAEDSFPMDSLGDRPAVFAYLFSVSIDAAGKVWVYDDGRDAGFPSTLRCIHTSLNPPHPFHANSQADRWHVGDVSSQLSIDMATMLQSGHGADVHLVAAGGEVLRAHSVILCARWPWFRAQQERWQQCGPAASGSSGSTGSSSGVREINAEEHTAAVMRVVLSYLYTGGSVLHTDQGSTSTSLTGGDAAAAAATPSHLVSPQHSSRRSSMTGPTDSILSSTAATAALCATPLAASGPATTSTAASGAHAAKVAAAAAGDVLVGVMHAAAAFELPALQAACVETARRHISVHNALPWLVAAHPYSAYRGSGPDVEHSHDPGFEGLKSLALTYAAQHYAEIKKHAPHTVNLLRQQPGDLALELMEACMALR